MARNCRRLFLSFFVVWVSLTNHQAIAVDYDDALAAMRTGQYAKAESLAATEVERGVWSERWPRMLLQSQLIRGQYAEAYATYQQAITRYRNSIVLRRMGIEALRNLNRLDEAEEAQIELIAVLQRSLQGYVTRENLIAAGEFLTEQGEDARKILELFYDRVRDRDPEFLDAYVATAELAVAKGDFQVAAQTIVDVKKLGIQDPRLELLEFESLRHSDSEKATASLRRALQINPQHTPSLLAVAQQAIAAERYAAARETLNQLFQVNPHDQLGWALMAVISHLEGDYELEQLYRLAALSTWSRNPRVDHLIGTTLSQKYRFREGADYQRSALEMSPSFTPAVFQLAQDSLRLGNEDVGWELAKEVNEQDPYDVVAYNLLTLKKEIDKYVVLEQDSIRLRMEATEAEIYGESVLRLLTEAKSALCDRYQVHPQKTISVEIFPRQSDFAIRTFGLPGGDGYLGVCFGRVITANSPASQGKRPANWKSVLWHEFAHVVTLEKTRNRMPRWLSEGISVYEERRRKAAWGESLTPTYREMLLSSEMPLVSDLSSAFMTPKSSTHLMFAYYQSSLVVQMIVEDHGFEALLKILDDLGDGLSINDALQRHLGSLSKLDQQFIRHAQKVANRLGPLADWSRDKLPTDPDTTRQQWQGWLRMHPTNYWGLKKHAQLAIEEESWPEALRSLQAIVGLGALTSERDGTHEMLVRVLQANGDQELLFSEARRLTGDSPDALPALELLIEEDMQKKDWRSVLQSADLALAVNPLKKSLHEDIAKAAESIGAIPRTIESLNALKSLQPLDPVDLDYRLAVAYHEAGDLELAKTHILDALERAPRFRSALKLLLEIAAASSEPDTQHEKVK